MAPKSLTGPRIKVYQQSRGGVSRWTWQAVGLTEVSPIFYSRAEAEKYLRAELAKLPASRRPQECACMCCSTKFMSEGIHHRMCSRCRMRGDALGDECRPQINRTGGRQ